MEKLKIVELTVSKGKKVQLIQFEPNDYFVALKTELEITDAPKITEIALDLLSQCEEIIRIEISNDKEKLV